MGRRMGFNGPLRAESALRIDMQGFMRQVRDWCNGRRGPAGSGRRKPVAARSTGFESTILWQPLTFLRYTLRYAQVRSIRQDEDHDLSTHGQQLPYVPVHNLNQQVHIVRWGYALRLTHQWTDAVSILADGSDSLPAVHLVHADVARSFRYRNHLVGLGPDGYL